MGHRDHKGFTIIEVTLFLAISAALLAGILAGSVSSIKRHRYNDSVNDFVDFLRRTYAEVINVENERIDTIGDSRSCSITGMVDNGLRLLDRNSAEDWKRWLKTGSVGVYDGLPGRTECAIYGMLVTFGEDDSPTIRTYDVIGRTLEDHQEFNVNTTFKNIDEALDFVDADILTIHVESKDDQPVCSISSAGNTGFYNLQWDARAEKIDGELFKGSLLIVRSPVSGTIHTLFMDKPIGANAVLINKDGYYGISNSSGFCSNNELLGYQRALNEKRLLEPYLEEDSTDKFSPQTIDICVASMDSDDMDNRRRDVRILMDGRNASAVELVGADDTNPETGNKCLE